MTHEDCSRTRNWQNPRCLWNCRGCAHLRGRLLRLVFAQVSKHIALLHKGLAAIRTTVRSLVRVRAPMRHQVTLAHKVLRAEVALEWTLRVAALVVRAHVEQQIALQRETLAALRADKWTLPSVTSHVVHQVFLRKKIHC